MIIIIIMKNKNKVDEESITVMVPSEILDEFRGLAIDKFTHKRGYIKKATNEAILLWIRKEKGE